VRVDQFLREPITRSPRLPAKGPGADELRELMPMALIMFTRSRHAKNPGHQSDRSSSAADWSHCCPDADWSHLGNNDGCWFPTSARPMDHIAGTCLPSAVEEYWGQSPVRMECVHFLTKFHERVHLPAKTSKRDLAHERVIATLVAVKSLIAFSVS